MLDTLDLIRLVVSEPKWELEWLDLLSQLEYIGCRKIVRSVPYERISLEVLRHISEEASHAFLLKNLVTRRGKSSWLENKFSRLGWEYFHELDARISKLQENADLNYPAVSYAVEQRVLSVYPLYLGLTKDEEVRKVLLRILAQEKRHGGLFEKEKFPDWFRKEILGIEALLWGEFRRKLEALIHSAPHDEASALH